MNLFKKPFFCLMLMMPLGCISNVHATDLMDVYHQALANDPIFKSAYDNFMAQSQQIPQATAALLPQLTSSGFTGLYRQNINGGAFKVDQTYDNITWKLSASQAIFNYEAWSKVQLAKANVKAALANFNDAAQNLILRTAKAYTDLLYAQDTLNYSEAKKRANQRQLEQAQARFNVGFTPITSVYEAQSAYDQSVAEVIQAQNNLINQNENIRRITNHVYENIALLRNNNIPLIKPEPNKPEEWVATGLRQNYALFAAKFSLQAARENIKAQSSGNWPTFNIQANTQQLQQNVISGTSSINAQATTPGQQTLDNAISNAFSNTFIPQTQTISSVVVSMNFPFYQGGLVEANTKQAQFNFQAASEQLEKAYREVAVNAHISFNNVIAYISKVFADRQTIVSQQSSLESVQAQFNVGTRTMTDVVNAQENLFKAQEQLAKDQYDLINYSLNLKYLAGTLNVIDLEEINTWLATTRINGLPHEKRTLPH
jgi:outer membrane protein